MDKNARIFVAGHNGLVGSSIVELLVQRGFDNLLLVNREELDLRDFRETELFFSTRKPEYVFLSAAKVGGILANNSHRATFIYDNLAIQNSVIHNSYVYGVKKLLFLGSSCIYPKSANQPIREDYLLTGELEYTNEPYAVAKIAGIKMCESYNIQYGTNFVSVMPTNLYGSNDNFDLESSHVIPALIRKIHLAKLLQNGDISGIVRDLSLAEESSVSDIEKALWGIGINRDFVTVWGSGNPRREFLHNTDMARACLYVMENVDFSDLVKSEEIRNTHINIGYGCDISIRGLAFLIRDIVGFEGQIRFDSSKPDGTYRKLIDSSKINGLGWKPLVNLRDGLSKTYEAYVLRTMKVV